MIIHVNMFFCYLTGIEASAWAQLLLCFALLQTDAKQNTLPWQW